MANEIRFGVFDQAALDLLAQVVKDTCSQCDPDLDGERITHAVAASVVRRASEGIVEYDALRAHATEVLRHSAN